MTRPASILGFALLALLAGCRHGEAPAPPPGAATGSDLSLQGLKDSVVALAVPAPTTLQVWFPAEAAGDESARVVLTAPVSGLVDGAPAAPGRPLAKGAPLLRLRSPELADLKARWLVAQARLARAQAELSREQRLAQAQAGARRDLELAAAEAASAQAESESARIALQARGVTPEQADGVFVLRAPAAGTVGAWKVQQGQGVAANDELGAFQTGSAALALVELPPPAPAWRLGTRSTARYDARTWTAEVVGLPTAMGDMTHRLTFRLRLSGAPLPLPGTPLEVQVPLGTGILLPSAALQQVEGAWGVFLLEGDRARFQPVRRGPDAGDQTLVLEGLKPGASVATSGAYLLKSRLLLTRNGGGDA